MMSSLQSAGVALSVALPLASAVAMLVTPLRGFVVSFASWFAAVPALVLALAPGTGVFEDDVLLLGTHLSGPDRVGRGFLLGTALVWSAAGWFAHAYVAGSERRDSFWIFFLATMGGNVGVVLAGDVGSFYAFYALMTFAAYGLVLHERTAEARRAGRVYLVLALVGEMMLLAGFWFIVGDGINLPLHDVPHVVASSPRRAWILGLVLAGFGVKAGAVPLHVWLPLAHPVAPSPASAILSGALINAGLLGWLRFLPLGEASLPELGAAVSIIGVFTVFYGASVGVMQTEPKTVLAYSSVSQMGFMISAVGVALAGAPAASAATAAVTVFAFHHSIAKGALFLGAAIVPRAGGSWPRRLTRAGLVVPALAIAGAPLTSGAAAKASLKAGVGTGPLLVLLSIGAIGSTLLMARFLGAALLVRAPSDERPPRGLWVPSALLLLAGNALFFAREASLASTFGVDELWSASWPILVGAAIARVGRVASRAAVSIPPGDVIVFPERGLGCARARLSPLLERRQRACTLGSGPASVLAAALLQAAGARIEPAERRLGSLGVIGAVALLLLVILVSSFLR